MSEGEQISADVEKSDLKGDILQQLKEGVLKTRQALQDVENKKKTEGPLFDFDVQVAAALGGINERKIVEKGGKVYWVGEIVHSAIKPVVKTEAFEANAHEDYKLLLGRIDLYPEAIVAVIKSFGIKLPVSDSPSSLELSRLVFDYVHGTTNAEDGSTPRELPNGGTKGADFVEIPSPDIEGLACRLFSGNREGHSISLVLKPDLVENLYQKMFEAGFSDPQGAGTKRMLSEFLPNSRVATARAEK